jgi:hypothetical protein
VDRARAGRPATRAAHERQARELLAPPDAGRAGARAWLVPLGREEWWQRVARDDTAGRARPRGVAQARPGRPTSVERAHGEVRARYEIDTCDLRADPPRCARQLEAHDTIRERASGPRVARDEEAEGRGLLAGAIGLKRGSSRCRRRGAPVGQAAAAPTSGVR